MKKQIIVGIAVVACVMLCAAVWPWNTSVDRAQNYHADREGVELNFRVMSEAVTTFRECSAMPEGWNDEIQVDYKKRGGRK